MSLLAYCSTHNALFIDLPVSPFVFHRPLLTAKGIDLVCDDSFHTMNNLYFFIVATLMAAMLFVWSIVSLHPMIGPLIEMGAMPTFNEFLSCVIVQA